MATLEAKQIYPCDATFDERVVIVMQELRLCKREAQVAVAHLKIGSKQSDIAVRLGCTKATVHEWCRRLHDKLGVHDERSVALVMLAVLWRTQAASTHVPNPPRGCRGGVGR